MTFRHTLSNKSLLFLALICTFSTTFVCEQTSQAAQTSKTKQGVIDLTHVLGPGVPDFHGTEEVFEYKNLYTLTKDGFSDNKFCTPEHHGTHVDAPCHFAAGGKSVDQIPPKSLVVPCVVLDVTDKVKGNADYCVTLEDVQNFEKAGKIPFEAAVLLRTGWSSRWTEPKSYRNADDKGTMHFPGFTIEAAKYLCDERKAVALGIDTLSLDPGNSTTYEVHGYTLKNGMYLIENLDNLDSMPARGATVIVAALPIKGGSGSPARIFGLIPD